VVEAKHAPRSLAEAVKAPAAVAQVDGAAERIGPHEVDLFEAGTARQLGRAAGCGFAVARRSNLLRQAHLDDVTGFAAFEDVQGAQLVEPVDGVAYERAGKTEIAGQPDEGKTQAALPFEEAMAQQMRIDDVFDGGKAQARRENVFELLPEVFGV